VRAAEPGSDHQLAFVRSFTTAARTDEHTTVLRGLLDGSEVVEGLAIDTDLRWHIVRALTSVGAFGEAEIKAEVERDPTAAGHRQAAAARASVPTAEAKAAAWAAIIDDVELPNAVLGATMGGFMQHQHAELLRPYVDAFFEAIPRVWETRTNEMAMNIITDVFPHVFIEQSTVDRVDRFLREADPAPPVRRMLMESRDGVARALRARARDASA
jgi:aminopeptidase N